MKKIFMEEVLMRLADLNSLVRRQNGVPTVVKNGELIYADVVFEHAGEYFRTAHRDGKVVRSFGAIETAVRALNTAGFAEVIVKNLDAVPPPSWIHASDEEVIRWEAQLDQIGHNAPIEQLREMLSTAPAEASSREFLAVFLEGYDRAQMEGK
jgi:hypothetical protein